MKNFIAIIIFTLSIIITTQTAHANDESGLVNQYSEIAHSYTVSDNTFLIRYVDGYGYIMFILPDRFPTGISPAPEYYGINIFHIAYPGVVPFSPYVIEHVVEFAPPGMLPFSPYVIEHVIEFAPPGVVPYVIEYVIEFAPPGVLPFSPYFIEYVVFFTTVYDLPSLIINYGYFQFSYLNEIIFPVSWFICTYYIPQGIYYVRVVLTSAD